MANDQNTFLAYRNYVEDVDASAIVTAAPEQGDRVAANVKTRESDDVWRFAVDGVSQQATVTIDFGQDRDIDVITTQFPRGTYTDVSEANPPFAASDSLQYRLLDAGNAQIWSTGFINPTIEVGYMTHYEKLLSSVTARKLEVVYDAPSRVTQGFVDIGFIGAWSAIEPTIGFAYPAGFGWIPNTESQRTTAGRLYTARFEPMRRWSLAFDTLTNAESLVMDEMIRYSGGARQIFVKRGDLPVGKDAMLCVVGAARDMDSRNMDYRQTSLTLEEFI